MPIIPDQGTLYFFPAARHCFHCVFSRAIQVTRTVLFLKTLSKAYIRNSTESYWEARKKPKLISSYSHHCSRFLFVSCSFFLFVLFKQVPKSFVYICIDRERLDAVSCKTNKAQNWRGILWPAYLVCEIEPGLALETVFFCWAQTSLLANIIIAITLSGYPFSPQSMSSQEFISLSIAIKSLLISSTRWREVGRPFFTVLPACYP